MTRKLSNWILMAALVVGLGMNVTSCKDDNDDNNNDRTPEEIAQDPYEKESEAADALYRLVSQLSVCDSLPNNWKTATFEPKAGKVLDASQPRVRTIAVHNAAEAVARYNSLTGKELPATTVTDTYKVEGMGTLQLNVGGAGTIATIDVNVKQMPQLAQLRLVSAADMGENGHFKGEPYYRFGDVVMDEDGCYWICVRPAYSPDGKEDTHWMSFHLTRNNIKTYNKKGCWLQTYPVDLGVQKEKMQYLAQLLAVLADSKGYKNEADTWWDNDETGFGGLQKAAMPVDSMVKQAKLWQLYNVWEKIMPVGFKPNEVETFKDRFVDGDDMVFIYEKGSVSGTNLTIRTVKYKEVESFFTEELTYEKVVVDMKEIVFDVTNSYSTNGTRGNRNCPVPDAFVVRYKTGYQLSSNLFFNPSATDPIPGVTTVHRFNDHKNEQLNLDDDDDDDDDDVKSYTKDQAEPRMIMAKNGKFYKSEAACEADDTQPVALVVYVGNDADTTGGDYRGLAMSYTKKEKVQWDEDAFKNKVCIGNTSNDKSAWELQKDGISRTKKLYEDGHNHPAAKAAWEFKVEGFDPASHDFSNWFLPTAGQVMMAVKGLGGAVQYNKDWFCFFGNNLDEELEDAGIESFDLNFNCWTSTEYNQNSAIHVLCDDEHEVNLFEMMKDDKIDVRPFIAF